MRLLLSMLLIALVARSASALEVERYEMGKHIWTLVHLPGGIRVNYVSHHTSAIHVSAAGFYGKKTINGNQVIFGVGWHLINGKEVVGDIQSRWVMASYPDGTFRICPSRESALSFGKPLYGVDAMKVPPLPNRRLMRQFWATKGKYYYRVKMVGTRWDCQRLANQWGFEAMVHTDGGSSLTRNARSPSIAKIYVRNTSPADSAIIATVNAKER